MTIKPIKTERDYKAALRKIDSLIDCPENSEDENFLEVLSILVEDYEHKYYPVDEIDPVEVIKYRMEEMGLKQTDLAEYLGGRSRVSEILNRKRKLTVDMVRILHKKLNLPAETLI
ncbi:MAG: helix-turn-helix domain-containing protein [Ignavibacteriaceae bacterium]